MLEILFAVFNVVKYWVKRISYRNIVNKLLVKFSKRFLREIWIFYSKNWIQLYGIKMIKQKPNNNNNITLRSK